MEIDYSFEGIKNFFNRLTINLRHLQFTTKSQLAFLEDFYLLVNDGIPANRAIEMMAEVTTGLTRDVALSIMQSISEGKPLAEGMRAWFPLSVVEIIHVGEEGGALNETIKSAIGTLAQRSGALNSLFSAISYPLLVIIMGCTVMIYLNNSVFLQFQTIKPIEEWPQGGRDLVNLANLIQNWWWLVILGTMGLIVFFRVTMTNYTGEFRSLLDKIPPFSLYRRFVAARLMETMGLLIANGVVFKNAIKVMRYQSNPYVTSHLVTMEQLLAVGRGNVADVLATGLIDDADIMRLRVMGEVKGFEHGLIRMGVYGTEQSAKTVKLISKIIGGALLVIGTLLVILIVRGIFTTGMSMGSA